MNNQTIEERILIITSSIDVMSTQIPYLYLEMISENTYKGGNEGLEWIYTGGIS